MAQHDRPHGGHDDLGGRRVRQAPPPGGVDVALVVHALALQHGTGDLQVFLHLAGRASVGQPHQALHHALVAQPDAQGEPPVAGGLGGGGLLGQGKGVAHGGGGDPGGDLNAVGGRAHHRRGGDRVDLNVGDPRRVQPQRLEPLDVLDDFVEAGWPAHPRYRRIARALGRHRPDSHASHCWSPFIPVGTARRRWATAANPAPPRGRRPCGAGRREQRP